ncbi:MULTISPECIES: hypothetical protein [unclassified Crossiella]|uniref:hypothetical protein n=1 Tax=unclassified Crossiella TaxID=2620835 RepID=UPI001FFEBD53|nr:MULTISPECIES: hypothetical protein [unclassified Crossiella]MCK2240013.1 hypothetical protein [Crossiella sp. S99.2]MCK2252721.1 hypothetical protein [Crossiella sp. S99.1]
MLFTFQRHAHTLVQPMTQLTVHPQPLLWTDGCPTMCTITALPRPRLRRGRRRAPSFATRCRRSDHHHWVVVSRLHSDRELKVSLAAARREPAPIYGPGSVAVATLYAGAQSYPRPWVLAAPTAPTSLLHGATMTLYPNVETALVELIDQFFGAREDRDRTT